MTNTRAPGAVRKRAPERMCVACRRRRQADELVRLAVTSHGVVVDRERRAGGRGAYICPDAGCIAGAAQGEANVLRRALRGGSEREAVAVLAGLLGAETSEERTP